jgi:hypothetical protein
MKKAPFWKTGLFSLRDCGTHESGIRHRFKAFHADFYLFRRAVDHCLYRTKVGKENPLAYVMRMRNR